MISMKDAVIEHAHRLKQKGAFSTGDGIELLGLKHIPENFGAGNIYITALKIISELEEALHTVYKRAGVLKK